MKTRIAPRAGALSLAVLLSGALVLPAHAQTTPAAAQISRVPMAAPAGALTGTVQQIMRGIFFPNANIIFTVQTHDPAARKPLFDSIPGGSGFNWVQWGQSLYSGWEDVDYAAIALAEASPMLLTPGRTCENGNRVPVDRTDWIMYSNGMLDAAKKTLEASRTRSMDAVSDATNDLNDACMNCHGVYRAAIRCVAPSTLRTPAR